MSWFSSIITSTNSVQDNRRAWENYDWSMRGEEWSNHPEWKQALVDLVLNPFVSQDDSVLEIGPGGGRWTERLVTRVAHLTLVDLTPACIELCRDRFGHHENVEFFLNDGKSLEFLADSSIDRIWSWDTFVHIDPADIRAYISQFDRVLKPGGKALIHHSAHGQTRLGWRSDMSSEKMKSFARESGLVLEGQFDEWGGGRYRIWPDLPPGKGPDIVSILRSSKASVA